MSSNSTSGDMNEIDESTTLAVPSKSFESPCAEYSSMVVPTIHIQEIAPQIQEVALTDSRGGLHHVYGVTLCSAWYFSLYGVASRGGSYKFKRWPPSRVWCGTLLGVALCSMWHFVLCGT